MRKSTKRKRCPHCHKQVRTSIMGAHVLWTHTAHREKLAGQIVRHGKAKTPVGVVLKVEGVEKPPGNGDAKPITLHQAAASAAYYTRLVEEMLFGEGQLT